MSSWERKRGRRRKEMEIRDGKADIDQFSVIGWTVCFGVWAALSEPNAPLLFPSPPALPNI